MNLQSLKTSLSEFGAVLMSVWHVTRFTFTAVNHFLLVRVGLALNCQTVYMFHVSVLGWLTIYRLVGGASQL